MMTAETINALRDRDVSAEISAVFGTDAEGIGPVELVFYSVGLHGEFGTLTFENVRPSHIRIVPEGTEIVAARLGDPVGVSWRGNEIRFTIQEGIAPGDCE